MDSSGSLRRRRTSEDSSAPSESRNEPPARRQKLADNASPVIEDPTFASMDYRVCFLRLKDHLFQIHLFLLLRDESSVFCDMLLMPSGGSAPQGFNREDPIVLTGDTLNELRAFHALAYTSLGQLTAPFSRQDLDIATDAGLFAHKYGLTTVRDYALRAIREMSATFTAESFSKHAVPRILRLTWLCGSDRYNTPDTDEFAIRDSVRRSVIAYFPKQLSAADFTLKMKCAEEFDCRPLIGDLCHLYLCDILRKQRPAHDGGAIPFPVEGLSDRHRSMLLTGYWSLTQFWSSFVKKPPPPLWAFECPGFTHRKCLESWARLWGEAAMQPDVQAIQSADIIRKLSAFRTALEKHHKPGNPCISAEFKDRDPVSEYISKVEESLADHYLGPIVPPTIAARSPSPLSSFSPGTVVVRI
ncbi:hypothetical protein FB451DRAFT_646138 [Mycena latifolia]|nr:hypothetical protein FB451DRAFT_646138 [Mycena latifolia]